MSLPLQGSGAAGAGPTCRGSTAGPRCAACSLRPSKGSARLADGCSTWVLAPASERMPRCLDPVPPASGACPCRERVLGSTRLPCTTGHREPDGGRFRATAFVATSQSEAVGKGSCAPLSTSCPSPQVGQRSVQGPGLPARRRRFLQTSPEPIWALNGVTSGVNRPSRPPRGDHTASVGRAGCLGTPLLLPAPQTTRTQSTQSPLPRQGSLPTLGETRFCVIHINTRREPK